MICGKVIYKSKSDANYAMKGANKDRRPGQSINRLSTIYYCEDCKGWHLASKCKKFGSKKKFTELHSDPKALHPQIMKRERGTLIIRNFSSKPI